MTRLLLILLSVILISLCGCSTVDDERIPNMPVNIRLADAGTWNSFGVAGFGSHRQFILANGIRQPRSFPFSEMSATGFGGVLLISGIDPFSNDTDIPLAYDLACPVERDAKVIVEIENETYSAVCHSCGSVFNVTTAGGSPISGPAASGTPCGLRRYQCISSGAGGYLITN
ncbi:MAG: hypothetical protein K2J48_05830 [Muribaculaceae bacterium]|nr:hypothetical protein [Muribaculaceae bacterium]